MMLKAAEASGGEESPGGSAGPPRAVAFTPRTRLAQRRPVFVGLCVALTLTGGVVTYVGLRGADQQEVLVVSADVARGQVIAAHQLQTMTVASGSGGGVAAEDAQQVIGKYAAVDLPAGSMLTGGHVTEALGVDPGTAVVGVGVTSAQVPTRDLRAGDPVRVVEVPTPGGTGAEDPDSAAGTVDAVRTDETKGLVIVDVVVEAAEAVRVAQWSSAGTAALVLDPAAADPAPDAEPGEG